MRAIVLVGDAPYYGRFGFTAEKTGALAMPGPFERHRLLGLELIAGASRRRLRRHRRGGAPCHQVAAARRVNRQDNRAAVPDSARPPFRLFAPADITAGLEWSGSR